MSKAITRVHKVLGVLCLSALFLVIGYSEMLHFSVLHSTITDYLTHRARFCNITSNELPMNAPILNTVDNTHTMSITFACNCSNSSTSAHPPRPLPVVDILQDTAPPEKQWHADKFWHDASTFPLCSMDSCFNFSRCADMKEFRIYAYGPPYEPIWYLKALNSTPWLTTDASQACVFLVTEPKKFVNSRRPRPSALPYWNGGLNHVIATLADKWSLTAPPPHTIGNASVLASCLQETTYRAGFDISMPLPGKTHFVHLQSLKPRSRKYFLTFRGTRYLGPTEGNFRSDPALRAMHNGGDVIIAVTCNQVTNNEIRRQNPEAGKGCEEDEVRFKKYNFKDLMNSTFGLAPAGRSPSSYRMIETMSAGAIPVLIADNYVKPFDTLIQWHQCALQFPTTEIARILPALRALSREEVERRQRYCLFIYNEYLKDDATLVRSVVKSLKLRFYGVIPQFIEASPTYIEKSDAGGVDANSHKPSTPTTSKLNAHRS